MKKKRVIGILLALVYLLMISYVAFNFIDHQSLSNLTSPWIALIAAVIIYLAMKKDSFFTSSLKQLGYMALLWGVADLVWFYEAEVLKMILLNLFY